MPTCVQSCAPFLHLSEESQSAPGDFHCQHFSLAPELHLSSLCQGKNDGSEQIYHAVSKGIVNKSLRPREHEFTFEAGSPEGFFLVSSQGGLT